MPIEIQYVTSCRRPTTTALTVPNKYDALFDNLLLRFGDRTHVGHSTWFLKCREWLDKGNI